MNTDPLELVLYALLALWAIEGAAFLIFYRAARHSKPGSASTPNHQQENPNQ